MKKTQLVDALKNIRKRWASFLSVCLIIAFGTGGFYSTQNLKATMKGTFATIYTAQNEKNFDLMSTGGIAEEEMKLIADTPGVESVEGVVRLDGRMDWNNESKNVTIITLTDTISIPYLLEGEYPSKQNECALNTDVAEEKNLKVGDTIHLVHTTSLTEDPLKEKQLTITGIVEHPDYVRKNATAVVVVPESAINFDALNNTYTNAFVKATRKEDTNSFEKVYRSELKETEDALWNLIPTMNAATKDRIVKQGEKEISKQEAEANRLIAEAEEEYKKQSEEVERQIASAEREITNNQKLLDEKLLEAKRQLEEGRKKLQEGYDELIAGENQIVAGEAKLNEAKAAYAKMAAVFQSVNKEELLAKLRDILKHLREYAELTPDQSELQKKYQEYFETLPVTEKLAVRVIENLSGFSFEKELPNVINKKNLNRAIDSVNETITKVEKETKFFQNLSVDEMLQYVNRGIRILEMMEQYKDSINGATIRYYRQQLNEYLGETTMGLIFAYAEDITGTNIQDHINFFANRKELEQEIPRIQNELKQIPDDSAFFELFTKEGIETYRAELAELVKGRIDALIGGQEEEIDQNWDAITNKLESKEGQVISKLMSHYLGMSLEEASGRIWGDESFKEKRLRMADALDTLKADSSFRNELQQATIEQHLQDILQSATDYKQAIEEDNAEAIEAKKQELQGYVNDSNLDLFFTYVEKITSNPLKEKIQTAISSGTIEDAEALVNTCNSVKEYFANHPEVFTTYSPDNLIAQIEEGLQIIDDYIVVALSGQNTWEELETRYNDYIVNEPALFALDLLKSKTRFDYAEVRNGVDNSSFIEFGIHDMHMFLDSLLNDENFQAEMMNEKARERKTNLDKAFADLYTYLQESDYRNYDKQTDIIHEQISGFAPSLFLDLMETYVGKSFKIDETNIVRREDLSNALVRMKELKGLLETYKSLPAQIAAGEEQIILAKGKLEEGWKQYYAGLDELNRQEALMKSSETDARRKIKEARELLRTKQAEATTKLKEAREELDAKKKEAQDKIREAREKLQEQNYSWIVQGRDANLSHLDLMGSIGAMQGAGLAFGTLFLLIVSMVCFSTIAMIVEEEKKQVGTTKAFGFYNREIFNKYLVFGVSAAVIGCLIGAALGIGLTKFVTNAIENSQLYLVNSNNGYDLVAPPWLMIITTISIIALCALATFIACTDLLKTPAALLMKDETVSSRDRKLKRKSTNKQAKGSLYSRLALRNMVNEKERVLITLVIVAASCFVVGIGLCLRDGFMGMMDRQAIDVYKYDVRVDYNGNVTESQQKQIETVLKNANTDYLGASYSAHLYEQDHNVSGVSILVADKERIHDFFGIVDPKTKQEIEIPDEGVLAQIRLEESFGLGTGKTMTVYDNNLRYYSADIVGTFRNYQGRMLIASEEAYHKIFHEKAKNNCFYVKLNGADYDSLQNDITKISDGISFEKSDGYKARLQPSIFLYNVIVYILTAIAIIMSFMILTNLANIYFTRKKKELIVMRINGFSIRQTIGYLAKETIFTTIGGIVIALIVGALFAPVIIRVLEQPDGMFVRDYNPIAWLIAAGLESLFAIGINLVVFQKVRSLNFRDVNS